MTDLERTRDDVRRLTRAYLRSYASTAEVRSIAVVGNAPVPPCRERAERIDDSDLVMRMNSFAIDRPGAEPCLGSKVDAVLVNRATRLTPWFLDGYRRKAFLQSDTALVHSRGMRTRPAEDWPEDLGVWQISNRYLVAELRSLIWADSGDARVDPTSGTLAAWLGHLLFPEAELRLAGLSYLDGRHRSSWEHHVGGHVPVSQSHRVDREGRLLLSWIASGSAVALS